MRVKRYNQFIIESKITKSESLNEGLKEILLSIGLLTGALSDYSIAQNKEKLRDNAAQIENILKDEQKKKSIISELEKHGMEDAAKKIEKNADEVILRLDNFKKGERFRTQKVSDLNEIREKLRNGWAISSIDIDTLNKDIDNLYKEKKLEKDIQIAFDSLDIDVKSKEAFEIGSFDITEKFKENIHRTLELLNSSGGTILKIEIESSTDKQRVSENLSKKLMNLGVSGDNKGLSTVRNNKVRSEIVEFLKGKGVPEKGLPMIDQNILYEQGKGELGSSQEQDPEARYVNIKIYFTDFDEDIEAKDPVFDIDNDKSSVILYDLMMTKVYGKKKKSKKTKKSKNSINNNPVTTIFSTCKAGGCEDFKKKRVKRR